MLCGAEDLISVCKDKIAPNPHQLSEDGKFSWEEVECLGACSNAPMAQIGKDYFEDLTEETMGQIIDSLSAGEIPTPGPQNGRFASEPKDGLTSLMENESGRTKFNGSVQMAEDLKDTIKRINGNEAELVTPWLQSSDKKTSQVRMKKPKTLKSPRKSVPEDLSNLLGLGEKAKIDLNNLGIYHISQISKWGSDEIHWVHSNSSGSLSLNKLKSFVEQAKKLRTKKDG